MLVIDDAAAELYVLFFVSGEAEVDFEIIKCSCPKLKKYIAVEPRDESLEIIKTKFKELPHVQVKIQCTLGYTVTMVTEVQRTSLGLGKNRMNPRSYRHLTLPLSNVISGNDRQGERLMKTILHSSSVLNVLCGQLMKRLFRNAKEK